MFLYHSQVQVILACERVLWGCTPTTTLKNGWQGGTTVDFPSRIDLARNSEGVGLCLRCRRFLRRDSAHGGKTWLSCSFVLTAPHQIPASQAISPRNTKAVVWVPLLRNNAVGSRGVLGWLAKTVCIIVQVDLWPLTFVAAHHSDPDHLL